MPSTRSFVALALVASSFLGLGATAFSIPAGSLVRASQAAVYYVGTDGKRYVFPSEAVYKSWYADFSSVRTIGDADLASMAIGGNVTYRPGSRMVKIVSDPKVYAVDAGGTLRPIKDEATAKALYGNGWSTMIDDVADAFFTNYRLGAELVSGDAFSPTVVASNAASISADRGLAINAAVAVTGGVDLRALPLGDGKQSSSAKKGHIYSCQSSYSSMQAGAGTDGPWISGSTWDRTTKASVDGSVSWPSAKFTITSSGSDRLISGNDLPIGHTTGTFPISSSDDAYAYDRNPNSIAAQTLSFTLPLEPTVASAPSCVGGEVGISISGVAIFNGFDAGGRDAVAHEVQDSCDGHPQVSGLYHYHGPSSCVATGDSAMFGYAFDGFGIFSNLENGRSITNDDLDACHGHAHEIAWNGVKKTMYHYHLTNEFPYTVGCFMGKKYVNGPLGSGGQPGGYPPPPRY